MPTLVSSVSVDSGCLVLADPAYLGLEPGTEVGGRLTDFAPAGGAGVVLDRFGGDGVYKVVAETDAAGRVQRATVYFVFEDYLAEHGTAEECRDFLDEGDAFPGSYRFGEIAARAEGGPA